MDTGTPDRSADRTPYREECNIDADTDEEDEGTDSEEPEEEEYSPPCRVAAKYLTNCPQCGRHMCHRTFRSKERALEQQDVAEIASSDE